MRLLQGHELSYMPYIDMLDVLSREVITCAFGPVRRNATMGGHAAGWRSYRAPARRQALLAADMLGAD